MSRRRNKTNRAGASIGINYHKQQIRQVKKKSQSATTDTAQATKKQFMFSLYRAAEEKASV